MCHEVPAWWWVGGEDGAESPEHWTTAAAASAQDPERARQRRLSFLPATQAHGVPDVFADSPTSAEANAATGGVPPLPADVKRVLTLCAYMSRAGQEPDFKKTNQDNCCVHRIFADDAQSLYGCFDGHGPNGHHVSRFIKENLPRHIAKKLRSPDVTDVDDALRRAFHNVDRDLTMNSKLDYEFSGSTSVVTLLRGTTMTTGGVLLTTSRS